jgi:predicted permease
MGNLVLIVLCLLAGVLLRQSGRLPENAHVALNGIIINVSLPALALTSIHRMSFDAGLMYAIAMPWIVFALGTAFFFFVGRLAKLGRATTGGLMLTAGLGNTSFVGLPMIEAFFGKEAMRLGLLIDQLGTYLVLSTAGVLVASLYSGARTSSKEALRKLIAFPPLLALLTAIAVAPLQFPLWLDQMLNRLGDTVAPLALLSVGYQLRLRDIARHRMALSLGLGFKLLLAPLLLAPLYLNVPAHLEETARVTLFEAAMAPMIGAAIVAMQHKLDPPLVGLMVGVGIPLSLITVPIWWYLLHTFG